MNKSRLLHRIVRWIWIVAVTILMYSPNFTYAQRSVPNGILTVAYRQLTDGKLSNAVYQLQLFCWSNSCSLTTLTLNLCIDGIFYPAIMRSSTSEGNLSVETQGDTTLIVKENTMGATLLYRFDYISRLYEQSNKTFLEITGFSGSAIKNSDILGRAISWELIPLQGRYPRVKIDCDASLESIPIPIPMPERTK